MHHHAHITLAGLITKLHLEYARKNTAILDIRLAGQTHQNGHTRTFDHHARAIGPYAEGLYSALQEGQCALVEGRLEQFQYTNRQAGEKRSLTRIMSQGVSLLEGDHQIHTNDKNRQSLVNGTNHIQLVGALVTTPQLKTARNGNTYGSFRVVVKEYGNTHYFNAIAWEEQAKTLAKATPGTAIHLTGQLINLTWTDENGQQHHTTSIETTSTYQLKYARPKPNPNARAA